MRARAAVAAVAVCAFVAVAAGCSSSGGGNPSTSGTTPGASTPVRGSGTVRLLAHDSFAVSKDVLADFTRRTGYKVRLVQPGDAGVVVNQAILRKDAPIADAIFGVDNTFLSRAVDAGIFDPYTPAAAASIPAALRVQPQNEVTPIDTANVCVIYDTSWFGHGGRPPVPASFDDLTDPRYRNLTVVENASTSSPGLAFLLATIKAKGDTGWQDYWRKLRANGVRVVDGWTQAYQSDFTAGGGGGDRPIVVSYGSDPAADVVYSDPHRDEPKVGVVTPTCFRQTEFAGVLKGAKNVAGARALVDEMLSAKFQADMPLQMYVNPVVPGVQVPPVFAKWAVQPPSPLTMDPQQIGAQRDAWIKEWRDIAVQ